MDKLLKFMQGTMERPNCYGWYHILCLSISLILIIYFYITRKNNDEKRLKRVLLTFGMLSLILETIKQIIWSYDNGVWDYQWYAFPFQLCTTPIFVSLIYSFIKNNSIKEALLSYLAFFTILGGLATMIYPESCFVRTIEVNIYTMVLHCGSVIVSLFILMTKQIKLNLKTFFKGFIVFIIFIIIAQVLNIVMYNTNIINGETFNMFYISPYFTSSLPIFDMLSEKLWYPLFLLSYIVILTIGALSIFGITKLLNKIK